MNAYLDITLTVLMMLVAALAPLLQVGLLFGLMWWAYRAGVKSAAPPPGDER
jgi:hypothetical protein